MKPTHFAETSKATTIAAADTTVFYWTRAWSWAWKHTEAYSVKKAVPPVLAAVAQHWLFHLHAMIETLVIVSTIVGGYLLLWGGEFLLKLLFSAPAAIYAEQRTAISELRALAEKPKRTPAEERRYQEAKEIVDRLSPEAKKVLRYISDHKRLPLSGEVPGLTPEQFRLVFETELMTHPPAIVRQQREKKGPGHVEVWWEITPGYQSVLDELL